MADRRRDILAEIGGVSRVIEGTLSTRKRQRGGSRLAVYHQLQRWRGGRNDTRHIPTERVSAVREGIAGYAHIQALVSELARLDERALLAGEGDDGKKKVHETVDLWAQELHRFVDTAAETLQSKELGEITWLEHDLRQTSQAMCRDVLRWLLALPGLRVPDDHTQPGERRILDQERTAHTLFGDIPLSRTYYYRADEGRGRFPLDEALGLIDGYTPGVAALIGRCAAEHPFRFAEESFHAYTGLTVDSRQFPRLAELIGPLAEQFLRANLPSEEKTPPRAYVATDGTGAPLRHEELLGRKGRQADGTAQTHEIKVGAIFTQHPLVGQKPWRDLNSNTYVATTKRAEPFGQMMRAEFFRRFAGVPEVVFLADGAPWNWELQRVFFPMALGIVDFYHAAQHVTEVVDLIEDHHTPTGRKHRQRWVKLLLRGKLDTFLCEARVAFPSAHKEAGEKALDYFEKNRHRMRYRYFRDRGYFIGSGVVEAACKTIVAQRLKGSGMHWSEQGLSHILALRTALLSRRYDKFWLRLHSLRSAA